MQKEKSFLKEFERLVHRDTRPVPQAESQDKYSRGEVYDSYVRICQKKVLVPYAPLCKKVLTSLSDQTRAMDDHAYVLLNSWKELPLVRRN